MSDDRRRIATLQAIVASSPLPDADRRLVIDELDQARVARRTSGPLRRAALHAGRALDAALGAYVESAGGPAPHSLVEALHHLASRSAHGHRWPATLRAFYESRVVQPRHRLLRPSDAPPPDPVEMAHLLNDIEACLAEALALW